MTKQPHQIVFAVINAPRSTRKSNAKSRNGCVTCKARHVKCSEEKPKCKTCTGSGRECGGYAPPRRKDKSISDDEASKTSSSTNTSPRLRNDLAITLDTTLGLPSGPTERRYLDHFRYRSIRMLAPLGDLDLWTDLVLQLSVSKPMIQLAMLALSAQHEGYMESIESGDCVLADSSASIYGMKCYSKGIAALNKCLTSSTPDLDLMEVMVACAIFACFEVLQGNGIGAEKHIRGGLQILLARINKQWEQGIREPHGLELLSSKPVKFLSRLDLETGSYHYRGCPLTLKMPHIPLLTQSSHEISAFSLAESRTFLEEFARARDDLYSLMASNYGFEHDARNLEIQCDGTIRISDHIFERQRDLLNDMVTWINDFHALVQPRLEFPSEDRRMWPGGLSHCKWPTLKEYLFLFMAHTSSYMELYTCLADGEELEGLYDNLVDQFKWLLRVAEVILEPEGFGTPSHDGWEWSINGNVIHPLTFIALKCRDGSIRRRAINLLSRSGSRGGWDGENLVPILQRVVNYEERQAREEQEMENMLRGPGEKSQPAQDASSRTDGGIPWCSRVASPELDLDRRRKRVSVFMNCPRDEAGVLCEVDLTSEMESGDAGDFEAGYMRHYYPYWFV